VILIIINFQAKALAEKNMRDMLAQREQAEKHVRLLVIRKLKNLQFLNNLFCMDFSFFLVQRLAEFLDPEVKRWSNGKEGNLRALLSTLQYVGFI